MDSRHQDLYYVVFCGSTTRNVLYGCNDVSLAKQKLIGNKVLVDDCIFNLLAAAIATTPVFELAVFNDMLSSACTKMSASLSNV